MWQKVMIWENRRRRAFGRIGRRERAGGVSLALRLAPLVPLPNPPFHRSMPAVDERGTGPGAQVLFWWG